MKSYENALRNECGYIGAQPYGLFIVEGADVNVSIDIGIGQ